MKSSNQPAIVGGGKSIFSKNKLGVPFGLAVMNDFLPNKNMDGGDKKYKPNKEMQLIKDELYDELLSLCNRTERAKKGIRTKTRSKKVKFVISPFLIFSKISLRTATKNSKQVRKKHTLFASSKLKN